MSNIKIILAGPGTGKTTKVVKEFISKRKNLDRVLVLSFTNATIKDLLSSFKENGLDINERNCMTLYKYALKINHLKNVHILSDLEDENLRFYSQNLNINFDQLCDFLRCITFRRMITSCISFIKTNPSYIKDVVGNLELLIIDEYQDFNEDERNLIGLVSPLAEEVLILGDDDQSIYGFKNADPEGIIDLFNNKDVIKIDHENKCYRCPMDVVEACNNLIINNKFRINKTLTPTNSDSGIKFIQKTNLGETDEFILREIMTIREKEPDSSIMVISPVHFAVESLINTLNSANVSNTNWFIKKIHYDKMLEIWKLRAIFAKDKLKDILFIVTEYLRKHSTIKKETFIGILAQAIKMGVDDKITVENLLNTQILDSVLTSQITSEPNLESFFTDNPDLLDYKRHLEIESDREKNLDQLEMRLNEPLEFDRSKVNIMSIHKSKGLQADYVFLIGIVNGILPNKARGTDSIEAQRRELYVAMSRTKKHLYLISTVEWEGKNVHKIDKNAFKYDHQKKAWKGQTSLFISELGLKSL